MTDSTQAKTTVELARRVGEAIRLGPEVQVRVVRILPHKVYLEVVAPKTMPVHRGEVYEAIRRDLRQQDES